MRKFAMLISACLLLRHVLHSTGTTDYMDRFIDEQDAARDRSASPTAYHSLIFGDNKKGESNDWNLSHL